METNDNVGDIIAYHRRTKHHLQRYAAGPDFLDWDDQPNPFRRFEGCETVELPAPGAVPPVRYADIENPGAVPPEPFSFRSLGLLLELGFGLSAWKQYGGDRWALRCNPSSGNLHPTEVYLAVAGVSELPDGVYHYAPHDHVLERRCRFQASPGFSPVLVGLTSIHWREAWKYGERAYRYCQHDVGHALAALRYSAAVLGWSVTLLADCGDGEIESFLGLDREGDFAGAEREEPDLLCLLHHPGDSARPAPAVLLAAAKGGCWRGRANVLSPEHRFRWPAIGEAARAALRAAESASPWQPPVGTRRLPFATDLTAADIIRQRRSAQQMDGITSMSAEAFFRLLDATLPRNAAPTDAWTWRPRIHLVLLVHRIDGLRPGLYALPRHEDAVEGLKAAMRSEFQWRPVPDCPDWLPLRLLVNADCRRTARTLSCHQSIASDGAFSLGMIAEFEAALEEGPWVYRRLFWEAGFVGQILYLEAEAAGMRGTGIGCFFDDAVHEVLGLADERYQSLYHFTVGAPLEDSRLQTLPPYAHLSHRP